MYKLKYMEQEDDKEREVRSRRTQTLHEYGTYTDREIQIK